MMMANRVQRRIVASAVVIAGIVAGAAGAGAALAPTTPSAAATSDSAALLGYAHVEANGVVAESSGNVTVERSGPGAYCIGVTGGTVHGAVATLDALPNVGGTIQVGVFVGSGCPSDASNIFVITRPQRQNGGYPGANRAFYLVTY